MGRVVLWFCLILVSLRPCAANLTAPKMKAAISGDSIQVVFEDLTETVDMILKRWKKGEEVRGEAVSPRLPGLWVQPG